MCDFLLIMICDFSANFYDLCVSSGSIMPNFCYFFVIRIFVRGASTGIVRGSGVRGRSPRDSLLDCAL